MSDNIFVYNGSSSEYETSSEEEDEEEVQVIGTPKQMKFYEHTNYVDNNLKNMTVTIVVNIFDSTFINWRVNFEESVIVHKICDIYLDNFITHHCKYRNSKDNKIFLLSINEFNIKNNVGKCSGDNRNFKDKLFIPNDHNSASATGDLTHVHKSKKLNYISTIQPTKISSLTGSITTLDGTNIWHDTGDTSKLNFTAEFIFQFRN
jgi:hypothetical protein